MNSKKLKSRCGACGCTSNEIGGDQQWFIDVMGLCMHCFRCYPSRIHEALRKSVEFSLMNMSPDKADRIFGLAKELRSEAEKKYDLPPCIEEQIEKALKIVDHEHNSNETCDASLIAYGVKGYREYGDTPGVYCHVFPSIDEIARAARNGIPLMVDPISLKLVKVERCLEILDSLKVQGFMFVPTLGCNNFDRTGRCQGHRDKAKTW